MTSLTNALPLVRGIDNRICFYIIDYFLNKNVWTGQVFSNAQYPYNYKTDLASIQRPSIFCYPKKSNKDSFSYGQHGLVTFELHFSLKEQREDLAQSIIQIANLIQIIIVDQDITSHVRETAPWIFWIGKKVTTDYTKAREKEAVITMELDYHIDLLAYKRGLQYLGCDTTSPDEQIYYEAKALLQKIDVLNDELQPITEEKK